MHEAVPFLPQMIKDLSMYITILVREDKQTSVDEFVRLAIYRAC